MIDEKKLEEVKSRVKHFLDEGIIKTKQKKEFVDFFLLNVKQKHLLEEQGYLSKK